MGQLREKMKEDLVLRAYRPSTVKEYVRSAAVFAVHFRRSPAAMGEREVREFLLHLINVKKVKPATHKMYVAALKFLYGITLGRPDVMLRVPYPRVPRTLPDILSGTEVEALLSAVASITYRAILTTAYATGMRISEACSLRVERGVIRRERGLHLVAQTAELAVVENMVEYVGPATPGGLGELHRLAIRRGKVLHQRIVPADVEVTRE